MDLGQVSDLDIYLFVQPYQYTRKAKALKNSVWGSLDFSSLKWQKTFC